MELVYIKWRSALVVILSHSDSVFHLHLLSFEKTEDCKTDNTIWQQGNKILKGFICYKIDLDKRVGGNWKDTMYCICQQFSVFFLPSTAIHVLYVPTWLMYQLKKIFLLHGTCTINWVGSKEKSCLLNWFCIHLLLTSTTKCLSLTLVGHKHFGMLRNFDVLTNSWSCNCS